MWGWICVSSLLLGRGGNWRRGWGWWGMWVEGHKLLSFPSWGWNRGIDVGLGWARGPPRPPNGRENIALYSGPDTVFSVGIFFHGQVGGCLLKDKVELHRVFGIAIASLMDMERKKKSK